MFRPRAIVFDMDGLLVDSEPLWFEVECELARRRGGVWTDELAHACIGQGLLHTLVTMQREFGFEMDPAKDGAELVDLFIARAGELALKPGAKELVALAFGKVPMAVASSSTRRLVHAVLERFDLPRALGAIVSGDDVARPKPDPEIFVLAAKRLGVAPRDCVVLEDSFAGVTAGRAAEMFVVAVPEQDAARFAPVADVVVKDLFEARERLSID
jgi:HAD superfamily hydrolase (TIGR01509 family)